MTRANADIDATADATADTSADTSAYANVASSTAANALGASPGSDPSALWSDDLVAEMVRLRRSEFSVEFGAARRHPQLLAVAWAALRQQLREWLVARGRPPLNVTQLKRKWAALRSEFRALRASPPPETAAYPSYWPLLTTAFGSDDEDDDAVEVPPARVLAPLAPKPPAGSVWKAPSTPVPAVRPRGPTEEPRSDSRNSRMRWTEPAVALLLELRLGVLGDAFRGSDSKIGMRSLWLQLRAQFAERSGGPAPDVLQLKNKYNALRKEFVAGKRARQALTRQQLNGLEVSPAPQEGPTHWATLEKYFAGRVEVPGGDQAPGSDGGDGHDALEEEDKEKQEDAQPPPLAPQLDVGGEDALPPPVVPPSSADAGDAPPLSTVSSPVIAATDVSSFPHVGRMKWDAATTATLLRLRAGDMADAFARERGPSRLKALWATLRGEFARAHRLLVDVNQLKNKFNALRKEFADLSEQQRAAASERRPLDTELPPYWDALVRAFGSSATRVPRNAIPAASESGMSTTDAAADPDQAQHSRKRRRLADPSADDEEINGERDPVRRLELLLERQNARHEEMRALLRRHSEELEAMAEQTEATNRAVLEHVREVCGETRGSASLVDE